MARCCHAGRSYAQHHGSAMPPANLDGGCLIRGQMHVLAAAPFQPLGADGGERFLGRAVK